MNTLAAPSNTLIIYCTANWLSSEHSWLTAAFTTAFVAYTVWYLQHSPSHEQHSLFPCMLYRSSNSQVHHFAKI